MKTVAIAALLGFVLLVAGCTQAPATEQPQEQTGPEQTEFLPPEGAPGVLVDSPVEGEVLASSIVGIKVNVTDFRLAGIVNGKANVVNEGHIHATLDGVEKMQSIRSFAFSGVAKGGHTLVVELVNNDHSPLNPAVSVTVRFRTE